MKTMHQRRKRVNSLLRCYTTVELRDRIKRYIKTGKGNWKELAGIITCRNLTHSRALYWQNKKRLEREVR